MVWNSFNLVPTYFSGTCFFNAFFSKISINISYLLILSVTENTMTIKQSLFADYPSVTNWMVTFSATNTPGSVVGSSSVIFLVNQVPYNGSCGVSPIYGVALSTYFTVDCTDWLDSDGQIVNYELNGMS
jgi:hypothetical protein